MRDATSPIPRHLPLADAAAAEPCTDGCGCQRTVPAEDGAQADALDAGALMPPAVGAASDDDKLLQVGDIAKLSGNFMIASCVETMAEVAALAENNGIAPEAVLGMLTSTILITKLKHG